MDKNNLKNLTIEQLEAINKELVEISLLIEDTIEISEQIQDMYPEDKTS